MAAITTATIGVIIGMTKTTIDAELTERFIQTRPGLPAGAPAGPRCFTGASLSLILCFSFNHGATKGRNDWDLV
jgi:hypothetical protein